MKSNAVTFRVDDQQLSAPDFLALVQQVWPGLYNSHHVAAALQHTINITAWDAATLIGCVRILTDGYFFGTVTEILVLPHYQGQGVGRRLMELAWEHSPTSLFLGAQPGKEPFFEKLGFEPSLHAYQKRKTRRS